MARIEDLISDISDAKLRKALEGEVKKLKKSIDFGLVFERHHPESVLLASSVGIREGDQIRLRKEPNSKGAYFVKSLTAKTARVEDAEGKESKVAIKDLLLIKGFDEPIFPTLTSLGSVSPCDGKPAHAAIQADNFHALEALCYTHEGGFDCIYIDPPYNTGARDWKYNNDYVDTKDRWRHSRWLSFMEKRLRLAKRLLKPDGVLIVTIDEHEVSNLGVLLAEKELFKEATRQLVTIVNNPKGVTQERFSRVEEYAYFCFLGRASAVGVDDDFLTPQSDDDVPSGKPRWKGLLRSGTNARREDRKNMFFPVLIDPATGAVKGTGEPLLPFEKNGKLHWPEPKLGAKIDGLVAAWPIRNGGDWGNWGVGHTTLRELIANGYVAAGGFDEKRQTYGLSYLSRLHRDQIAAGTLKVVDFDEERNVVDARYTDPQQRRVKKVWHRTRHDAGAYGSDLVSKFLGERRFDFPKSLYAVSDTLATVLRDKPDALILDFFAGSGTTLHAACLLNASDGGNRRVVLVTNNEVEEETTRKLAARGFFPSDDAYEAEGIFEGVMRPRCEAVITGRRPDGNDVSGKYLDGMLFSNGFDENIEFLRLDYLDPNSVELGQEWDDLLPLMWLAAGGIGEPPKKFDPKAGYLVAGDCDFAVLADDELFAELIETIGDNDAIQHIFLLTDSEDAYAEMTSQLPGRATHMWPRDYLRHFRQIAEERS